MIIYVEIAITIASTMMNGVVIALTVIVMGVQQSIMTVVLILREETVENSQ